MDKRKAWGPRVYIHKVSDKKLIEECKNRGWKVENPVIILPPSYDDFSGHTEEAEKLIATLEKEYGLKVKFSPQQAKLISALMIKHPRVARIEFITDYIWGSDPDGGPLTTKEIIRVLIAKTRKQLKPIGIRIENDFAVGWRLLLPDLSPSE